MLLSAQSLEKRYGSEVVFSDLSFTLDEGHRVALVGRNGAGKSTVMKIIAGLKRPDSGSVALTNNRRVAYLPQEVRQDDQRTGTDYFQEADLLPHQFFPVLEGLKVPQAVADRRLVEMSGGQRTKILLTRFLLEPSDILLLDEPTNNLDIPSLLWLEAFLSSSKKAMIIISHDLVFLNQVANRVFELKDGSLSVERGTYGDYLERKKKEFARQMKEYRAYVEEVKRLERGVSSLRRKGERIDVTDSSDSDKTAAGFHRDRASSGQKQAKTIQRRIEKLEKVEKPFEDEPFILSIETKKGGTAEITADEVVVGYANGVSVGPVSFRAKPGDRFCFMGMNGAGKSTMLKTIAGLLPPRSGSVEVTEGVLFGDLMQQHERADRGKNAIDFFVSETGTDTERGLHMLKRSGFTDQMVRQTVAGLSSGMRARLLFAVFMTLGVNVLILDEPTNHLDIEAVAALKDLLKTYSGVVLLVSHNRWFLEGLSVDTYYDIADGKVGRIKDFEKYLKEAQTRADSMVKRLRRVIV